MAPDPGHPAEDGHAARARPAVFLDRDGTLIEDVDYLSDPADIRILPGVAAALSRLAAAGFGLVIVTNQSAVGRGMITLCQLDTIHTAMARQFADLGVSFDGIYFCPEKPLGESETLVEHEDRKPGAGMLRRAARELGLDLIASWMIGDKLSDVLAGFNAGCRSIRVRTGKGASIVDPPAGPRYPVLDDLPGAALFILENHPLPPGAAVGALEAGSPR